MKKIIILLAASMQSLVSANYSHAQKEREIDKLSIGRLANNPNISALSIPFFESEYYAYVYSSGTLVVPYSGGAYPNMSIPSQGITGLTATTQAGAGGNITFNISGFASGVGTAYFFTVVNNQPIQFQVTVKEAPSEARVASLDCSSSNATGTFSANTPSVGSKDVLYTGGNGLPYFQQKIISTGVTGLTAVLNAGTLNSGNSVPGKLTYQITGIPSSAGKAYFTVVFGGQNCAFSVDVNDATGRVLALNCGATEATGTFSAGNNSNGTKVVEYISGNGQPYASQVVESTGVTGLTAVLTPGVLNFGNGSVTYQILGVPASAGVASFVARIGDKNCTFSVNVDSFSPVVTNLDCSGGALSGTYRKNSYTSNGSKVINYQGGNGSSYRAMSINSTGVTGLTATADAGKLNNGNGSITFKITGTPNSAGTASFAVTLGSKTCTFNVKVSDSNSSQNRIVLSLGGDPYVPNPGYSGAATNILLSPSNFGPNGTVNTDKFSIYYAGNSNNKLAGLIGSYKPYMVVLTWPYTLTDSDAFALFNYLEEGGRAIVLGQAGMAPQKFLNLLFGNVNVKYSQTFALKSLLDVDHPVLNGPFGDVRGKFVGDDNNDTTGFTGFIDNNDIDIFSTSPGGIVGFAHKKYKLFFWGDGGFASGIQGDNSKTRFPAGFDGLGRPMPKIYYQDVPVYNSVVYANAIAWLSDDSNSFNKQASNKSSKLSNQEKITTPLDLNKKTADEVKLFPNPASNYVKISGLKGKGSYQIFNQGGKPVANGTVSEETSVDVSTLIQGVYIMSIEDATGKHDYKFLKK
ncbi:T9SS type A sorting domain-containing protein [Chryseobacterium sp. NRRL B-14859]|uniref:T9SS type A sorting domain-containing protein n=1 Tax=Chryseobacterium sp. NRRL B-14859 TaxID=1562763 RepID=UPI00339B767B